MLQLNTLFIPPSLLGELAKWSNEEIHATGLDFSNLVIVAGGSGLSTEKSKQVVLRTGVKAIVQVYGCTENSTCLFADEIENFVHGSGGLLVPNAEFKVFQKSKVFFSYNGYCIANRLTFVAAPAILSWRRLTLFQIVDLKTREILGPHQQGEVCVKSPSLFRGYVNNPEATINAFDSEGWFRMGELCTGRVPVFVCYEPE